MTDIDKALQNPAFKSLEAGKIALIKKLNDELQGKNQIEAAALVIKYAKSFSEGKPVSKEDRDMMISVMMEQLPQKDKEMFQKLVTAVKL